MDINILKETGALLEGHFELNSGLHSDTYIQCAKLLQTRFAVNQVEFFTTQVFEKEITDLDVVIGGAYGGIIFAFLVARQIEKYSFQKNKIRAMFCERVPFIEADPDCEDDPSPLKLNSGKFQLRRGFEINKGDKVLIAEDVTTTGKSIGEVAELVKEYGGEVVGAISIIDRREWQQENLYYGINVKKDLCKEMEIKPFISLIQLDIKTWKPEECPLCKTGIGTSTRYDKY